MKGFAFALGGMLAVGLVACRSSERKEGERKAGLPAAVEMRADTGGADAEVDSIPCSEGAARGDSSAERQILTTGAFHGDEVPEHADSGLWMGLFRGKDGPYLARTRLRLERVHDPIVDETENDRTGWEVGVPGPDSPILLIEDRCDLARRAVPETVVPVREVFPGDTVRFRHEAVEYQLFATGEVEDPRDRRNCNRIHDYQLHLSARIGGKERRSSVVALQSLDENMVHLLFAGDIDGDGILDFVFDTSGHYNLTNWTLFLSRPAGEGELVKFVGSHSSAGC